ncbi:MAG: manganese efflux pump MntP family protein [Candidatus Aminicenantaceae bacterium]
MSFAAVFGIALALAMDAFAVTLGIGAALKRLTSSQSLRLAFSFGLFQFGMPLLGWAAGRSILPLIEAVDHWVAAGLLFLVAGRMAYDSFHSQETDRPGPQDPTRGLNLLLLAVATSIDALAVGLSLAMLSVPILYPALVIGAVAFAMTLVGARIGPVLGRLAGKRAALAGALVLFAIAIKILIDHL